MSAIAGIYPFDENPSYIEHGRRLMDALTKYPADQSNTWNDETVFLGCHAQWITPESVDEPLPYYDSESRLAITADAILDNRSELFELLEIERGRRKTIPDSELILSAYRKWGEESPKYLVGDFAFMIWDAPKKQLFGARDFSGTRTLYFSHNSLRFAFCSVIEPLLSLPDGRKELNEQWLAEFLAIPVTADSVDPSSTVYKHIQQVPPAHTVSISRGVVAFAKYCTLGAREKLILKSNQDYEEAFRDVFQQAVQSRIRTRGQVGAHLSGGLDSGSVASFAARALQHENKRLHTFSYVPVDDFEDWTPKSRVANERPFIESTVQYVGNITDHYLDFKEKSPLSEVDDWLEALEMPYKFFENSFWLKGIYEEASAKGIGVLLNGQRGNWTISWGPALDYQAALLRKLKWIRFYNELDQYSKTIQVKKSRILRFVGKKAFPSLYSFFSQKDEYYFPNLINPHFAQRTNVFDKIQNHGINISGALQSAYKVKENQFKYSYYWSLNGTIATKLSLRYRLWERDPTNDLRVIRFCLSLPEEQFVQNGLDRALIRRSTKNYLPDNVRLNHRTRGAQGADGVHRMAASWTAFIEELQRMIKDEDVSQYLNKHALSAALAKIQEKPQPEYAYDLNFRILMRGLIFYRFLKKLPERG